MSLSEFPDKVLCIEDDEKILIKDKMQEFR